MKKKIGIIILSIIAIVIIISNYPEYICPVSEDEVSSMDIGNINGFDPFEIKDGKIYLMSYTVIDWSKDIGPNLYPLTHKVNCFTGKALRVDYPLPIPEPA